MVVFTSLPEHGEADTLTVAKRVAGDAIDEAISKAEFHTDNQVRWFPMCLSPFGWNMQPNALICDLLILNAGSNVFYLCLLNTFRY